MSSEYIQVKDANGKDININVSKICDINGDNNNVSSSIKDSVLKNRINFEHEVQIVDSNGKALDSIKLLQDLSNKSTNIVALDVEMEATHSGKNHNYCIYYEDSMEKDAESFMNPFHKPMLKNHDDHSEPLGRIISSCTGPSQLTDERSAIHLTARVTDQDAIPKFLDKRYGTVSIGGSMGTVTCNICGKTILKDGKFHFCGHWKGETYKDQVCYWGARDIEYHEVSVVNNPADDFAQIMKVTVLTDKDTQDNQTKEESSMSGSDSMETNVDEIIDQALGTKPVEEAKDAVKNVADQDNTDTATEETEASEGTTSENVTEEGTTEEEPASTEEASNGEATEESTSTEDTSEKDARISELEKELADAKSKIEQLETDAIDAQSQIDTLTQSIEDARAEATNYKQRCVTLATANKQAIVDGIVSKESFESEDAKEERVKDLMIKSMKELKTISSDMQQQGVQRTTASVANPCLAVNDPASNGNDNITDTNKNQKTDNHIVTVDDAAQEVIKRLFK
jgi:hypothetical protein